MSNRLHADIDLGSYFKETTPLLYCLDVLLSAKGWYGYQRTLIESLPHFSKELTLSKYIEIMDDFGFGLVSTIKSSEQVREDLLPCLLVTNDNAYIVLEKHDDDYLLYDGNAQTKTILSLPKGTLYFFDEYEKDHSKNYVKQTMSKFKKQALHVLITSVFLNIFSLLLPFFVMTVYDRVLLSESRMFLIQLLAGMLIITGASILLNIYQNKVLSYISAKLNIIIGNTIFAKVITLESAKIESVSLGAQVSKLKEFEIIKDILSGPVVQAMINIPFVLLTLIAIYILAGSIVFLSIFSLFCLMLIGWFVKPYVNAYMQNASQLTAARQTFLVETMHNIEQLKLSAAENIWMSRYRDLSAKTAIENYRASLLNTVVNYISEALITLTAVGTIFLGVYQVINHQLSIGGLIAIMMLVWRVLSPVKIIESHLPKLLQVWRSIKRINALVALPSEVKKVKNNVFSTHIHGDIVFHKVVHRYQPNSEPKLLGASFQIKAGELVMIRGANGSGKSTIFHILTKLYLPLAGHVSIDGKDIRQINTYELRQLISYVPQVNKFFYGTLRQNLQLANPMADDKMIQRAFKQVDLFDEVNALPQKLDTRFTDDIDKNFSSSFLQRFALARALVKQPKILLLDDPVQHLDKDSEVIILNSLRKLHGQVTILMITHRPSHLKLADKIFNLQHGVVQVEVNQGAKK